MLKVYELIELILLEETSNSTIPLLLSSNSLLSNSDDGSSCFILLKLFELFNKFLSCSKEITDFLLSSFGCFSLNLLIFLLLISFTCLSCW